MRAEGRPAAPSRTLPAGLSAGGEPPGRRSCAAWPPHGSDDPVRRTRAGAVPYLCRELLRRLSCRAKCMHESWLMRTLAAWQAWPSWPTTRPMLPAMLCSACTWPPWARGRACHALFEAPVVWRGARQTW